MQAAMTQPMKGTMTRESNSKDSGIYMRRKTIRRNGESGYCSDRRPDEFRMCMS